jgi:hypothetical protein
MSIAPILRPRIVVMFALALILAVSAYGFAAANVVPDSLAGSGEGTVSGYWIETVNYGLNATDPTDIDSVAIDLFTDAAFTTNASTTTVAKVQFLKTGGTAEGGLYTCAINGAIPDWTCTAAGTKAKTAAVTSMRVIAYQPQP